MIAGLPNLVKISYKTTPELLQLGDFQYGGFDLELYLDLSKVDGDICMAPAN